MQWLAALALTASLLAGCDKKDRSPAAGSQPAAGSAAGSQAAPAAEGPEVPAGESLRRITELGDKICACPDRRCAEALHAEFQAENQKLTGRPRAKPTQAEAEALQAQARRFSQCVQRLPQ